MANDTQKTLFALTGAALSLGLGNNQALASSMEENTQVNYKYSSYTEDSLAQEKFKDNGTGSVERYDISVHQLRVKTPISESNDFAVNATFETLAGASPWWVEPQDTTIDPDTGTVTDPTPVQVMSGATIEESRTDINLSFGSYGSLANSTVSVGASVENDYLSINLGTSLSHTFNKKTTTIDYGFGVTQDFIEPTDPIDYNRIEEETKNSISGMAGISQVVNKNLLLATSVNYAFYNGYLSDPYKRAWVAGDVVNDARPDTKSQMALNVIGRYYLGKLNAAIHADYRFFSNSWGIDSHTVEAGWFQNLPYGFLASAKLRYYNQSQALFYRLYYNFERADGYYSSDYRLSKFEAVSGKFKLSKEIKYGSIDIAYENYVSTGTNPGLVDFSFISLSTQLKF